MTDTDFQLKNIDPEDIDDVLLKIEKSFGFRFDEYELKDVKTFGELCDRILHKIKGTDKEDCTSQQAFYKLRNAIKQFHEGEITPATSLKEIFPLVARRRLVGQMQRELGFSLKILRAPHAVTGLLMVTLILSLVTVFFHEAVGISGLLLSMAGIWAADKLGTTLDFDNVAQLVAKITRENYVKSRRNRLTVNRKEVIEQVKLLFIHDLDLDPSVLTRDALLGT